MISGKILRDAIISGANNINNQRSRVDELNVFPVPDGDTGTNMGMTVLRWYMMMWLMRVGSAADRLA